MINNIQNVENKILSIIENQRFNEEIKEFYIIEVTDIYNSIRKNNFEGTAHYDKLIELFRLLLHMANTSNGFRKKNLVAQKETEYKGRWKNNIIFIHISQMIKFMSIFKIIFGIIQNPGTEDADFIKKMLISSYMILRIEIDNLIEPIEINF